MHPCIPKVIISFPNVPYLVGKCIKRDVSWCHGQVVKVANFSDLATVLCDRFKPMAYTWGVCSNPTGNMAGLHTLVKPLIIIYYSCLQVAILALNSQLLASILMGILEGIPKSRILNRCDDIKFTPKLSMAPTYKPLLFTNIYLTQINALLLWALYVWEYVTSTCEWLQVSWRTFSRLFSKCNIPH